jgi:ABC-type glycerol-3-phosphate transport system permease component
MTEQTTTIARPKPRRRISAGAILQAVAVAIALLIALAPIYWMVATSFKSALEVSQLHP